MIDSRSSFSGIQIGRPPASLPRVGAGAGGGGAGAIGGHWHGLSGVFAHRSRSAAANNNAAINLDNAQTAVNNQVLDVVGGAVLDSRGDVGGYTTVGSFGTHLLVLLGRWDIPEGNRMSPLPLNPFITNYNATTPNETWLADSIYRIDPVQQSPNDRSEPQRQHAH